ncbi:phosphatase domain-containing protein [Arthrobacter sp.]|uniref:App1 family protein n=1 Tax=Arthrobacter sp. TaxID=1667 RepID=UPI0028998888|nr:phosphatase domain-containing protein [Arthrobacter sp.]
MSSTSLPGLPAVKRTKDQALHIGARLEDRLHASRMNSARKRGGVQTVLSFTGYGSTSWVRVLGRVVLAKPGKLSARSGESAQALRDGVRGWRNFVSPPVNDALVCIEVGEEKHLVTADRGGVIDVVLPASLAPGWTTVTLRPEGEPDAAAAVSPVLIVDPEARTGVISDIDDTIMVTALPRPMLAAWNTFVLDEHARTPTPGMAVMMDRLARENDGGPVFYLSTGAWNVAPALTRFITRNLYPAGPLLLTDWGPTRDRWFRSGPEHKRTQLERLATEFPEISWLLIGDNGQHDEAIYSEFCRSHPKNVRAVAIRQLSPSEAVLAGGRSAGRGSLPEDIPWIYASDGAGMSRQLSEMGLLPDAG